EWGLRFYTESAGGLPLTHSQPLLAGELIAWSELSAAVRPTVPVATIRAQSVTPSIPLRLISLGGRSAYSSAARGLLPFEISREPADRIRLEQILERRIELSYLDPRKAEARQQILSGLYEDGWMSGEAAVILKPPAKPHAVQVEIYIPPDAP